MKTFPGILVLALSSSAFAQSPATDIHVTGEHPMAAIDTPDSGKQLALVDAERKTLLEAVARLQDLPEVKALQLKPNHLDAYAAAIVDIQEQSARTATAASGAVYQVDVILRLDASETTRRLGRLRKDQEASSCAGANVDAGAGSPSAIVGADAAPRRTDARRRRQGRAGTAADADRTPREAPRRAGDRRAGPDRRKAGRRAGALDGRTRAGQTARGAALALSPDAPDAHYGMGDVLIDAGQLPAAEAEYRKALLGGRTPARDIPSSPTPCCSSRNSPRPASSFAKRFESTPTPFWPTPTWHWC